MKQVRIVCDFRLLTGAIKGWMSQVLNLTIPLEGDKSVVCFNVYKHNKHMLYNISYCIRKEKKTQVTRIHTSTALPSNLLVLGTRAS